MSDRLQPLPLPNLTGRRFLVTGGTSGVGLGVATTLATAGACVTLTSRTRSRAEDAVDLLRTQVPDAALHAEELDTNSRASVDALVERWGDEPLHGLVLNAGRMSTQHREENADGHEVTMATNALGHVRLTHGLLPSLRAANGRVATLGSLMALRARPSASDVCLPVGWSRQQAYARSKFACVVFALELQQRAGVAALPAHPGWSTTAIFGPGLLSTATNLVGGRLRVGQSGLDGAQPVVAAVLGMADLAGPTGYLGPRRGLTGAPGPATLPRAARDAGVRTRWWMALCQHAGVPTVWQ